MITHVVAVDFDNNCMVSFGLHQKPEADYVRKAISKYFKTPVTKLKDPIQIMGFEIESTDPIQQIIDELTEDIEGNKKAITYNIEEDGSTLVLGTLSGFCFYGNSFDIELLASAFTETYFRYIKINDVKHSEEYYDTITISPVGKRDKLESVVVGDGLAHHIEIQKDGNISALENLEDFYTGVSPVLPLVAEDRGIIVEVAFNSKQPKVAEFTFDKEENRYAKSRRIYI